MTTKVLINDGFWYVIKDRNWDLVELGISHFVVGDGFKRIVSLHDVVSWLLKLHSLHWNIHANNHVTD